MTRQVPIINMAGDYEESLVQLAKHLGTSKVRRAVFQTIYGRKRKPRSIREIMKDADIDPRKIQQVRNELDLLSRHNLIEKIRNDGSVSDGSLNLYKKNESIRANKAKIVALADSKAKVDRIPTKRKVDLVGSLRARDSNSPQLRKRPKLRVLYLTASPAPKDRVRVDLEYSRVQQAIQSSKHRDKISIEHRPAADINSILDGLNNCRPKIVHFSGHSSVHGLAVDNQKVTEPGYLELPFNILAYALRSTDDPPEIVVLNSCNSSAAKSEVLKSAKALVSMNDGISDTAAVEFAARFYAAIASGQSLQSAFRQGTVAVATASGCEYNVPELFCAIGVDAKVSFFPEG